MNYTSYLCVANIPHIFVNYKNESMKHIAIIGATGSTGKELTKLALAANYKVTSIERNPKQVSYHQHHKVIKGDVSSLESLVQAFEGMDMVISCFGPSNHKQVGNLMSEGTINIVKACERNGVKRFVFMSGCVQADPNEFSLIGNLAIRFFRNYYRQSYATKIIAEQAIQDSSLDWVIVRAVGLKHSRPTGQYKAGVKARVSFSLMSYADCAKCLLDAVDEKSWTRQIINVGKF